MNLFIVLFFISLIHSSFSNKKVGSTVIFIGNSVKSHNCSYANSSLTLIASKVRNASVKICLSVSLTVSLPKLVESDIFFHNFQNCNKKQNQVCHKSYSDSITGHYQQLKYHILDFHIC